jgi:NitT/TauT family transport system ATP-binding protein
MSASPHALAQPAGVTASPVREAAQRPHVTIRGLNKRFDKTIVYDDFNLDIPRGELISVFGPNGCGKSTLINMIAGLVATDSGKILFDGRQLDEIKFGYVFQNYREALFPWMRAFDNIAYPLKLMRVPAAERRARTEKLVAHLGIKLDLGLYPYQMSGGQQQLVSILRALVVEPEILFLDEPFSALDYEMTLFMREQLQRIYLETRTTTVLVSHDLEEAVFLADRILLLSRGPARMAAFAPVAVARPSHGRDTLQRGFRTHQGRMPRRVPARGAPPMRPPKGEAFLPIVGVAGMLAVWSLATALQWVDRVLLPSPVATFDSLWRGMDGGPLGFDFVKTVYRTAAATLIAAVIAIPLGIVLGSSEKLYRSLEFVIDFFARPPPPRCSRCSSSCSASATRPKSPSRGLVPSW